MTGRCKVYELVARTLAHQGHDTVFGLLGSGNFLFTDAFVHRYQGRFVWVRHGGSRRPSANTDRRLRAGREWR